MANLVRRKQVDQVEFSGFFVEVGNQNYYPVASNPSGFLTQAGLNAATGTLNTKIDNSSGYASSNTLATGQYAALYTNSISGILDARLVSTGANLSGSVLSLSGYVNTVSGNLSATITGTGGFLDSKINTLSGYSASYTNTVSGVLDAKITASSNSGIINSIASGENFNFTGKKTFNSDTTFQRINLSGVGKPSSIAIVAASGSVSIVGSGGTFISFIETGVTNSLWSVADSAGLPMMELFDDYTLVLGHSSRKSIVLSGISGYVLLPNLPTQTQTGSLPNGTLFRSGNFLMIL